jgi:hypothetical protein
MRASVPACVAVGRGFELLTQVLEKLEVGQEKRPKRGLFLDWRCGESTANLSLNTTISCAKRRDNVVSLALVSDRRAGMLCRTS